MCFCSFLSFMLLLCSSPKRLPSSSIYSSCRARPYLRGPLPLRKLVLRLH